jgi:hypothetical protein
MIAGLLYFIGLVAVLVSIAIAGYQAPEAIADFNRSMGGGADVVEALAAVATSFGWVLPPFVGGLGLMGFGRIIMLLTAINRSLRRG